jgi:hypothetical protein
MSDPAILLVVVTGMLVIVGFLQAWMMNEHRKGLDGLLEAVRKQADIAREALTIQFRPKVIVRSIKLDPTTSAEYDRRADEKWKIELHVMNIGETIAHVNKCEVDISWLGSQPTTTLEQICKKDWPQFSLAPGERKPLEVLLTGVKFRIAFHILESAVVENGRPQITWPLCGGTIEYADSNRVTRRTSFHRVWQISSGHFAASTDPELEYTD